MTWYLPQCNPCHIGHIKMNDSQGNGQRKSKPHDHLNEERLQPLKRRPSKPQLLLFMLLSSSRLEFLTFGFLADTTDGETGCEIARE